MGRFEVTHRVECRHEPNCTCDVGVYRPNTRNQRAELTGGRALLDGQVSADTIAPHCGDCSALCSLRLTRSDKGLSAMASDQYDVTRRETLTAIGLTSAVGLAPPAAIANAQPDPSASNAVYAQSTEEMPSLSDYGRVEQGGDILSVLTTAIADAASNNTRLLRIPSGNYTVPSTVTVNADDLTIVGHGATIASAMTANNPLIKVDGGDVSIIGLRTELTATGTTTHMYRINGENCRVHMCDMEYTAGNVDTPAFYIRGGNGAQVTHCTKRGSNAFIGFLEGSDILIAFNQIYAWAGGDDAFAIKAINQSSENIRIIGNHVHQHASIMAIGSNIGAQGVDDPTYSRYVRNVVVQGNVGHGCGSLVIIKPGAIATQDYRNGLVEDVTISDNILTDMTGEKFATGVEIKAGRGAIVRNIRGSNNIIRARASGTSSSGRRIGALWIVEAGGGAMPTIKDIDIEITYNDPHDGAAFETAGTAGYPVESIARIEPARLNLGDINLRIEGNGCAESGVYVASGGDGAVTVEKLKLKNYNVGALGPAGGFRTASAVTVMTDNVSLSGTGSAKVMDSGGSFTATTNPLLV